MLRKLVQRLILAGLLLTPLLGLSFWLQVIPALGVYDSGESNIILIKVAKDVVLVLTVMLWLVGITRGQPILCDPLILVMATLIGTSFLLTVGDGNPLVAVAGLRGLSPFLLMFVAYNYVDMRHVRHIARVLVFLLLVEFCAACVRSKIGAAIHGLTYLGLAARPCGTFASPSSWASFLSLIVCFLLGFDIQAFGRPRNTTWVLVVLAIVLVFWARSGAGLLSMATVIVCYVLFFSPMHASLRSALGPILLCTFLFIVQNLQFVTGRSLIYRSISTRIAILLDVVLSATLKEMVIGAGLGVGSNVARTFAEMNPSVLGGTYSLFIADSLYTSLISQGGVLLPTAFVLFNICLFWRALAARYLGMNPIAVLAIPSVLVASLGNVVTEVFPVNWLLFIVYGVLLGQNAVRAKECGSAIQQREMLGAQARMRLAT